MRQYKIIAGVLLTLPIIDFAFALPIAVQETHQLRGDVVSDVAITMSAKRGDETEKQPGVYIEGLSGKPESSLAAPPQSGSAQLESDHGLMNEHALSQNPTLSAAPDYGSMDHLQAGTSEIQEVSPELTKSPSLNLWLHSPESSASFASADDHMASPDLDSDSDSSVVSDAWSRVEQTTGSPIENPKSKSFLSELFSKVKFWRRISGPGSAIDAINVAQREMQGLVDTEATMNRNIRKSSDVPPTTATRGVRGPAAGRVLIKSQEISVA